MLVGLYRKHWPLGFVDGAGWLLVKGVECVGVLRSADRLSRRRPEHAALDTKVLGAV